MLKPVLVIVAAGYASLVVGGYGFASDPTASDWCRFHQARIHSLLQAKIPSPKEEDRKRFPKGSFGFVLQTGVGERIDTRRGLVTKDLVSDPDTTIALAYTDAELDTLYEIAIGSQFFDYAEPHPRLEVGSAFFSPSTEFSIYIDFGSKDRRFRWNTGVTNPNQTDEWLRLYYFIQLARCMMYGKDAYISLPNPTGAYF